MPYDIKKRGKNLMTKRVFACVVVLVLALAIIASAQNLPRRAQTPLAKPRVEQPAARPGAQRWPGLDTGDRAQRFYRFVCLERYLMPPSRAELEKLAVAIGLTEEQKQRIRELYQQFFTKVKPLYDQKAAATKEVLDILQSPSPNKGALTAAGNKVNHAVSAILDAEFDFWLDFRAILNTQQQAAFIQFMQQKVTREMNPPIQRPGAGPGGPPPAP